LYLFLHVWHLSIDSEHAPHDLHRFNLGSNESMNPFDFETTNCSATIQKSLDDSPHEGNPLFMSNIF
jgi:hypothetical protein